MKKISVFAVQLAIATKLSTVAIDPLTQKLCSLFHPILERWDDHFCWSNDFTQLIGRTATGRATIELLKMNRPILVELRSYWKELRLHPLTVE